MTKYLLSYYIEKLHRHCFDNIYVQDRKKNLLDKTYLRLFDLCCWIIPDYREYLRKWHENKNTTYIRYKSYNP